MASGYPYPGYGQAGGYGGHPGGYGPPPGGYAPPNYGHYGPPPTHYPPAPAQYGPPQHFGPPPQAPQQGGRGGVGSDVSSDVTLLDYLRETERLTGTKYMCREGGCGACIVAVTKKPGAPVTSVNSCLVSVTSCSDWSVTTIEQLGSARAGYHALQTSLAANNGSQCGHCSPGWIMAMYSLLKTKPKVTMAEVEKSFASNICRCTGYRPILETFKKFASDAPAADRIMDIEDLRICEKSNRRCESLCDDEDWCFVERDVTLEDPVAITLKDGKLWYKARTIRQIFKAMPNDDDYMLVAGNTAKGVYPISGYPKVLIDISDISELRTRLNDQNLIVGAGHTLTELTEICTDVSKQDGFNYLKKFLDHLDLVAHIPVKNLGSIAGNLMIKHEHQEFQSDVFLLLASVGAQISVKDRRRREKLLTMEEFLTYDMSHRIIVNVLLPPLSDEYKVMTYKIMPRAQNAHAIVNAGFTYQLDAKGVTKKAIIAYGGIAPKFVRAKLAERYLVGRQLFTNETLQGAIKLLKMELVPEERLPEPSGEYRQKLAIGLFYKSVLALLPAGAVHARLASGATELRYSRPVSRGEQTFHTDPSKWPINKPTIKLEALIQCSGEAVYTGDILAKRNEVAGAFVLSTVGRGRIASIDASVALAVPGVIAFYKASDIPGVNNSVSVQHPKDQPYAKQIFADHEVKYYNQAVGLIVAETHDIANRATELVRVKYTSTRPPVLNLEDARLDKERVYPMQTIPATEKGADVHRTVKGRLKVNGQYQFPLETLLSVVEPTEFGLKVYPESQWVDHAQGAVWQNLELDQNRIDVTTMRLGGAFGLKLQEPSQVAVACSLVAQKLQRPCRIVLPLSTVMRMMGKRVTSSLDYKIEVDAAGVIQHVKYEAYNDFGYALNELTTPMYPMYNSYFNVYNQGRFDVIGKAVLTDNAANGSCRGPGTTEAVSFAELMIERIATELSLDPLEVRMANIDEEKYGDIKLMVERLKKDSDYDNRKKAVDSYNLQNRWKKRGIRLSLSRFAGNGATRLYVNMSVFAHDGSVSISHSAVDMGQGLNTLAAQTAAYLLKIPIEKIQIKISNTNATPNVMPSGGSLASVSVIAGVEKCCKDLLEKLQPVREDLPDDVEWKTLIETAFAANVDLTAHGFLKPTDGATYDIFGVAVSEVEVDVLTGEMQIVRVDLLQDVGRSINPYRDIGQIEGAFVMGVGYWTSEELVYSGAGELRTDRSWTYKVPQALDIPNDFRVYFRDDSVNDAYLGCKAVGEPPICLAVSVPLAMREAITAARLDAGIPSNTWFDVDGPYTLEKTCLLTASKTEDYKLF